MKKILMFAASLFMATAVFAQPGGGGFGGPPQGFGQSQGVTISDPAEQAKEFVASIKDDLKLSDKQEKSLVKLYTNHFSKLQTLKAQISDLEKYTEQRLTTEILTTEQATEWKEVKKKVKIGSSDDSTRGSGNFDGFMPGMMPPPMGM